MDDIPERIRQLREAGVIFEEDPAPEQFEHPAPHLDAPFEAHDRARAATERYNEARQRLYKAQLESEQAFADMLMEWMKLGKLG